MPSRDTAQRLEAFLLEILSDFPWELKFTDWRDRTYSIGRREPHWRKAPLSIHLKRQEPGKDLLNVNPLGFLEHFVAGDVDMEGNLYVLADIRDHVSLSLSAWRLIPRVLGSGTLRFQNVKQARVNVKTHYDIPQEALNLYLDKAYMSYSCGMFSHPAALKREELIRPGQGESDDFDSLEKAQWRKFKDAADFLSPARGEKVLDVGCGYGGQLQVILDSYPGTTAVGWTHSSNQVTEGRKMLSDSNGGSWELYEGDFREENRVFDHVSSTGMISHVGPRGLVPYVKNVRRRIRKFGHYLHHAIMTPFTGRPLDSEIGVAFNKRYVWPGFHWFTLGTHVKALEENGFEVLKLVNLSPHYAKTTASWYERMMASKGCMIEAVGEKTFRAWQVYLAAASGGFYNGRNHVYRLYTRAV